MLFECKVFEQSDEKGASQTIRNACRKCGRTEEAHGKQQEQLEVPPEIDLRGTAGMSYRAILVGVPGLERPQVTYTTNLAQLDIWMKGTLAPYIKKYPGARIDVFQSTEIHVHRVSGRVSDSGHVVLNSESLLTTRPLDS